MMDMGNTVLVTGYAKAPQGTTVAAMHGYVGIVLLIDRDRDTIVAAEPTFVTGLAQRFISDILIGYDINQDEETLRSEIRRRYWAPTQHALVQAIQNAFQRYRERTRLEAGPSAPCPAGAVHQAVAHDGAAQYASEAS